MELIIVESPTKAKTIQKFLGSKYKVMSSNGHVRDLPADEIGIDVDKNFEPKYIILPKAKKNVQLLKKEVKNADGVILSTDPDREGEAIAYHLSQALALDGKPYKRVVFHEITKPAIEEAFKNPGKIDINLVDAQQARRILDRLVGYKLSPFLWKKVIRGLSAGRVQSVAVRLIVEREREIQAFKPEEYWSIEAILAKSRSEFGAMLIKQNDKPIEKLGIKTKEEADKILKDLEEAEYKVIDINKKETIKNPLPPFTTSTLQQDAWRKFHASAKFTMRAAQSLYEKGLITYHRTDSLNISEQALASARDFIIKSYGGNYAAESPRRYKTKSKVAQEAHEAIRPTKLDFSGQELTERSEAKIYDLIWKRFVASQMSQAVFNSTTADISAKNYIFRATGQTLKFDGFLRAYPIKFEETNLPDIEIKDGLDLVKINPLQHFTQPPARYSEATLIKNLEGHGIGRPSTYAPTLDTIQQRGYVKKDEKKLFYPTEIGILVNDTLVQHFPEIVDINFTAEMEEKLDKIARAETQWLPVIENFYRPFAENLKNKYKEVEKADLSEKTEEICPECGKNLLIRQSRYGKFYACSDYPKCKYKKNILNTIGVKCPKCKEGDIIERKTKRGKTFYGCSNWPKCDFALWDKPTGEVCAICSSLLTKGRWGVKCSNKECSSNLPKK